MNATVYTPAYPHPEAIHDIAVLSRDELMFIQLERMKWSLRHAYENVALYRNRCIAAGVQTISAHYLIWPGSRQQPKQTYAILILLECLPFHRKGLHAFMVLPAPQENP